MGLMVVCNTRAILTIIDFYDMYGAVSIVFAYKLHTIWVQKEPGRREIKLAHGASKEK